MKKIFSAFLLMTMMVASVGSFVSCSDIEDAIAKVENTANDNAAQIKDLESKIAALQTALATAQADAAAAKAEANAAKQAAATAKAEAIEAALAEIAKVQDDVDAANAEIKKINDALAGYATKEAVELLESTIEKYSALTDKNADAIEAIKAELAALKEAGVTPEKFAEVVADMEAIDKNLVDFAQAVADQIQSITYVPENPTGTIATYEYVIPVSATTSAKSPVMIKAEYEVSPKNLATKVTNVKFATVQTKAAAAEYFNAEVVDANDETGRIVVYGYIPQPASATDKGSVAFQTLSGTIGATATGTEGVSLSLLITDAKEVEVAEGKVDLGSYVQSAYVKATAKSTIKIVEKIGFKGANGYTQTNTTTSEVAYSASVADSKKNIFANAEVVVAIEGKQMTIAEASEFLGVALTVTNTTSDATYNPDIDRVKKATKYTKNALASTVEYTGDADNKPVTNDVVSATVKSFKVNGQAVNYNGLDVATTPNVNEGDLTATGNYKVINPSAAAPTFADINVTWNYKTNADFVVPVSAVEVATSGVADIEDFLNDGTDANGRAYKVFSATDAQENVISKIRVTRLSSAAVQVSYETGANSLSFAETAKTYTFTAASTVGATNPVDYTLSLNVNVGARPEDEKIINLGAYTRSAVTSGPDTFDLDKNIVDEIIKADAEFYGTVSMAERYQYFAKGAKITTLAAAGNTVSSVTYTYMKNATTEATTAADAKSEKTTMTLPAATATSIANGHMLVAHVNFRGVNYYLTATVELTVPEYGIERVNHYYDANGKVKLVGKATVPTVSIENKGTTAAPDMEYVTTADNKNFVLNEIFLNDYISVTGVTTANKNDVELYYELQNTKDEDDNTITNLPSFDAANNNVYAKPYAVDAKAQIYTGNDKVSEFTYKVYLRSTKVQDANNDWVVYDTETITLYVPEVATLSAPNTVEVKYSENATNTANIVGALKVVDLAGKDAYNPYATELGEIFASVSGDVTAPSFGSDVFNVYGQNVVLQDPYTTNAPKSVVKVMVDGVETTKLNYTIQDDPDKADFGQITLANDAVINSSVEFHVTVYMSTMFDDETAQSVTAVVKFVK